MSANVDTTPKLEGVNYLGCIYNAKDRYANVTSVDQSKQLFVIPPTEASIQTYDTDHPDSGVGWYNYPDVFSVALISEGAIDEATAYSSSELSAANSAYLNISGSYGAFSGEVKASYSSEYTRSAQTWNVTKKAGVKSYDISMMSLMSLRSYLSPVAQADIDGVVDSDSADALVQKWGTHFLWKAIFGGEWIYSQSVSMYSYSTSSDAKLDVEANYKSFTSSGNMQAGVEVAEDESNSTEESSGRFHSKGGDPAKLTGKYDDWAASIPGNYALVEFTEDSLQPLSVLAADNAAAKLIEAAIESAFDAPFAIEEMSWVKNTMLGVEQSHNKYSDYDSKATYVAEAGYVVTGFGGRVGSHGNFSRIAVERMRLSDGSIDYKLIGDITGSSAAFNEGNYDQFARVPKGHALVGMAVREHDKDLSNLVLYSQEIVAGRPTSHYLDAVAEVVTVSAGGTHDGYEKKFQPAITAGTVIVGLAIKSSGSSVSNLLLELAELQSEAPSTD